MPNQILAPYLCVKDADQAIDFYKSAFGGKEKFRLTDPSGKIGHAELDLDGTTLMIADEFPEWGAFAPDPSAPAGVTICLQVENADEVVGEAVKLGATIEMELSDQFYGERSGVIRDPFGHRWHIGHTIEEVEPGEMQRRYDEMMASMADQAQKN